MLSRLLIVGRPAVTAAEIALRAAIVTTPVASTVTSNQAPVVAVYTSRDGGCDASTSYGVFDNVFQTWSQFHGHIRLLSSPHRAYATISSATPCPAPASHEKMTVSPSELDQADSITSVLDAEAKNMPIRGLDMKSLMSVLLHPLPLGRKVNKALFSGAAAPAVQLGRETLYFDPSHTLSSTMRALHVIKRILRDDGHVLIVNPNPAMRPLVREAAYLCVNRNVWFWYRDWKSGTLADTNHSMSAVLDSRYCQPNRRLMNGLGLAIRNPLCPPGTLEYNVRHPAPKLSDNEKKQLDAGQKATSRQWHERQRSKDYKQVVNALAVARAQEAKLLPAGVQPAIGRGGHTERLALVVSLDLSYSGDILREASERKIPTVSLLNGHSDAAHVTFPVYASESHARFQHFFLEWLLRVVNLPDPGSRTDVQKQARDGQSS